ncbi:MAG: DUF1641 domain-containing protein [Halodesulfurarchaeum sp.]|nr:DUF1641 domain-containing protein [Halodesulfurarchaeum sp.]
MSDEIDELEAESEAIQEAADTMVELQQDGTLDDLTEAATAVSLLANALDDEMVVEAAGLANELGLVAGSANQPNVIRTLATMMDAMDEANAFEDPEQVGMFGAVGKMRDPDVQRGLGFLLEFLGALGRQIERRSEAYEQAEN